MNKIIGLLTLALLAPAVAGALEPNGTAFDDNASGEALGLDLSGIKTQMTTLRRSKMNLPPQTAKAQTAPLNELTLEPMDPSEVPHAEKRGLGQQTGSILLKNGWSVGGEIGGGWLSKGGAGGYGGVYAQKDFGQFLFVKGVLGYGYFHNHSEQAGGPRSSLGPMFVPAPDPAWPEGSTYDVTSRGVTIRDMTVQIGPSVEAGVHTPRLGDDGRGSGARLNLSFGLTMVSVRQTEESQTWYDYSPVDKSARPYTYWVPPATYWVPNLQSVTTCVDVYDAYGRYLQTNCTTMQIDNGYWYTDPGYYQTDMRTLSPFSQQVGSRHAALDSGWRPAPTIAVGIEIGDKNLGGSLNYKMISLPLHAGQVNMFTVGGRISATDE